jgi:hypothetical protein
LVAALVQQVLRPMVAALLGLVIKVQTADLAAALVVTMLETVLQFRGAPEQDQLLQIVKGMQAEVARV